MSKFTDAVERGLRGLNAVSVGVCPGCEQCRDAHDASLSMEEFEAARESGDVDDCGSFSYNECGICGTRLGGDRYVWHWVGAGHRIVHEEDCCSDCALYLANGDEPEDWRKT